MKGYFRKRGEKWSFTIDVGLDPTTGKRKQKTVSGFKTKKEAQLAAAALHQELSAGAYFEEKEILFRDFVEEWIRLYSMSVKVSTVRVRRHESGRLMEYFENLKMKNITRKMYQDALLDLHSKGLAANTISGVHATGRMIFAKAIELEIIKNDPTQYAKLPRTQRTIEDIENQDNIVKYLEKEELAIFLRTAREKGLENDYPMFLLLAYSGMRAGELCALKWKDVNFNDHTVSITKTYYNPGNRAPDYQLLTPKTKTSIRTIELAPIVFDELNTVKEKHTVTKQQAGSRYHDADFVFAKKGEHPGYPEFIKTIENRMRRLLKLSGLNQGLTPHSLRHTHTSLLAEAGVGIQEIMERLGHKDDEVTKSVYLHVTKTMKKEASNKFAKLMKSL